MVKLIKTYLLNYDYIIGKEVSDIKRIQDLEIISTELSVIDSDNDIIKDKESKCNEKKIKILKMITNPMKFMKK